MTPILPMDWLCLWLVTQVVGYWLIYYALDHVASCMIVIKIMIGIKIVVGYTGGWLCLWMVTQVVGYACGWLHRWLAMPVDGYAGGWLCMWMVTQVVGYACG